MIFAFDGDDGYDWIVRVEKENRTVRWSLAPSDPTSPWKDLDYAISWFFDVWKWDRASSCNAYSISFTRSLNSFIIHFIYFVEKMEEFSKMFTFFYAFLILPKYAYFHDAEIKYRTQVY